MRKFAKISAVLAAMVLALAFVGCNSDDDDDGTFASYSGEKLKGKGTYTGDTTKDGDIEMTATEWEGSPVSGDDAKMTITIKNSSFEFLGDTYTKNKNGTGTTSTANVVTTWQRADKPKYTISFFDNNTFIWYDDGDDTYGRGTYTGDTTKDGDIKITLTMFKGEEKSMTQTVKISNSSMDLAKNTYNKK